MTLHPEAIASILSGLTIKEVIWNKEFWPMSIDEILFTDGSILVLSGGADLCEVNWLTLPDGRQITPESNEQLH